MKYKLERKVNGAWHHYGTYGTTQSLARATLELGLMGVKGEIQVTELPEREYTIAIEEVVSDEFKITATSMEEAIEIAKEKYGKGEIALEPGNLQQKSITCLDEPCEWYGF